MGTSHVDTPGWTLGGTVLAAGYIEYSGARSGYGRLGHWTNTGAYTVSTSQNVGSLANGTYTLSMWVTRGNTFNDQYIYATGYDSGAPTAMLKQSTADNQSDSMYVEVKLTGIPVNSGQCTIGIYSDGPSDAWANIDDVTFVKN